VSLDEIELAFMSEVMNVVKALDAAKDPGYEAGMRRTVPSSQPAHGTRVPEVKKLAAQWLKEHKGIYPDDLFYYVEALWGTGWREERLFALELIKRHKNAREALDFETLRRRGGQLGAR